jgi:ketosteroid isomerase-like protein
MNPDVQAGAPLARPTSPADVMRQLLEGVAKVINGDHEAVEQVTCLYAEQTTVTHPMAHGARPPLTMREELRAHFAPGPQDKPIPGFRAVDVQVHETSDPEVVVTEFSWATDDNSFPCVFVTRVRRGLIVESRDYVDHTGSARLFGET